MSSQTSERQSKNQRRQEAREQARLARAAEQKREKRNRLLFQGGVAAALIGLLVIAAIVITNTLRPAGPAIFPANMASGGANFTKDLQIVPTEKLAEGEKLQPTKYKKGAKPVHVRVFSDFMCPACGSFEKAYGKMLEQHTGAGDVQLEVHPMNFLDPQSAGTRYSTRAANLFSCTVDQQPEHAFSVYKRLYEVQPQEGTTGLTNKELLEHARTAGVNTDDKFTQCVNDNTFGPFIDRITKEWMQDGIGGLEPGAGLILNSRTGEMQDPKQPQRLFATPTVIVNGEQWFQPRDGDLEQHILKQLQGATAQAENSN